MEERKIKLTGRKSAMLRKLIALQDSLINRVRVPAMLRIAYSSIAV